MIQMMEMTLAFLLYLPYTGIAAYAHSMEYFKLQVDDDWNKLTIRKLIWLERRKFRDSYIKC